ncbi:hypothetical protein Tco_0609605, partial [Tanacetum coccineum]
RHMLLASGIFQRIRAQGVVVSNFWCQKWCHVSKMKFGTRNAMAPEFSGSGLDIRILVP